jgi:hypothetical protein
MIRLKMGISPIFFSLSGSPPGLIKGRDADHGKQRGGEITEEVGK